MLNRVLPSVLGLAFFAVFAGWTPAANQQSSLALEDKAYLDGLLKEFIFDPPDGAQRVGVKIVIRSVWASSQEVLKDGWFVPGKEGKLGRVFFVDGYSMPEPKDMAKVDFVAVSKSRYGALADKKDGKGEDFKGVFDTMAQRAIGAVADDDLAQAAWLYRIGQEELAARALAAARAKGDPRGILRGQLAWSAFAGMVHAYMVRADDEALAHGERLLRLYGDEMKKGDKKDALGSNFQASLIVEELKRRQKKGTFGKTPSKEWPMGFEQWDAKKKTTYLIDALEEADVRQDGQPGFVPLYEDRRVQELVRVGEAAVPALIDVVEKDERLTRCVHFWRDFAQARTVLSVREAALTALMDILRVRFYQTFSTGGNFTSGGADAVKAMTKKLRAYWAENGKLTFDERMMNLLTNPTADSKAKVEAAENLATPDGKRRVWPLTNPNWLGNDLPREVNPAVAKFNNPTAAEAILAALDNDPKAHQYNPGYSYHFEDAYLSALIDLGDKRIAPVLAKRVAAATSLNERRRWATAAHFLGERKPFGDLADEFRTGKLDVPRGAANDPEQDPLKTLILALINVGTPAADLALYAVTDPKHPHHQAVFQMILGKVQQRFGDDKIWEGHPFCLAFLRPGLRDKTPTKAIYKLEKNRLLRLVDNRTTAITTFQASADLSGYLAEVAEKACDPVAIRITDLLIGVPRYHPLLKTADQRMAALEAALDKHSGNFRRLTADERDALGLSKFFAYFMPDVRPLNRAATAADVKAGKAIFHLAGNGKPADLQLPAVAIKKVDANNKQPPRLLIVQAEVDSDGEMIFGVITQQAMQTLPARALTGIKSLFDEKNQSKVRG